MPSSKIVDEREIERWIAEGKTYRWMVAQYLRKYDLQVGISMFGNFRSRKGIPLRIARDVDLIPWHVEARHEMHPFLADLRKEARRRSGLSLTQDETQRVDSFLEKVAEGDVVIHYDPQTERGWHLLSREAQDTDIIRQPPAGARRRRRTLPVSRPIDWVRPPDTLPSMASRTCWHCGSKTHMSMSGDPRTIHPFRQPPGSVAQRTFQVCALYLCDECRWPSIGVADSAHSQTQAIKDWLNSPEGGREIEWIPQSALGKDFPDVPDHIASTASEAYSCHSVGAFRGAGALARAVVEATAKDNGIVKGSLQDKIDTMEAQGLIRANIKDAAHEVRHFGNNMAHGDLVVELNEEESDETLELMSEILNEVYQAPAKILRRREARIASKASHDART